MAEYISEEDFLDDGRRKINDFAIAPALRAEKNSTDAKKMANDASSKTDNLDQRLTDIADGLTDDTEVKDARNGFPLIGRRLDDSDGYVRLENVQTEKSSIAFKRMNTSPSATITNTLTICAYGNSLTAGNGAESGYTWVDRLRQQLNIYSREGQTINLIKRAIGGYTAQMIVEEYPEPSNADIAIIAFGTNEFNQVRPTEEYVAAMETLITRELETGTAVVLCTAPQWGSKDWMVKPSNGAMEDFNAVTIGLGRKYGVPVLDLYRETRNLNVSAFKTGEAVPHIHLSDIGYQMWAQKMAAFIGFQHPDTIRGIKNGDFLGIRSGVDGIKTTWLNDDGLYYYLSESSDYPTPTETTAGMGLAISADETERVFHYAVNIEEDNLLLFPNFKFKNDSGSLTIQINGQNNPFPYSNPFMFYTTLNRTTANHTLNLTRDSYPDDVNTYCTQNIYVSNKNFQSLPFATKGYYVVTVKAINVDFFGFDCVAGNVAKLLGATRDTGWIPLTLNSGVTNQSTSVPSAYRRIIDSTGTRIILRIALKGSVTAAFATLPPGYFRSSSVMRLPASDGTGPALLVIGVTGNLVATANTKDDFRADVDFYL